MGGGGSCPCPPDPYAMNMADLKLKISTFWYTSYKLRVESKSLLTKYETEFFFWNWKRGTYKNINIFNWQIIIHSTQPTRVLLHVSSYIHATVSRALMFTYYTQNSASFGGGGEVFLFPSPILSSQLLSFTNLNRIPIFHCFCWWMPVSVHVSTTEIYL